MDKISESDVGLGLLNKDLFFSLKDQSLAKANGIVEKGFDKNEGPFVKALDTALA